MNKLKSIVVITAVAFSILSCGNTSNEKGRTNSEAYMNGHHEQDEPVTMEAIELNNGEKWQVNAEMLTPIMNMKKDMQDFALAEKRNYVTLAGTLQTNIDDLISTCTMKGKAHEELHKWLLPLIDLVKGLSNAKDESESEQLFVNIEASFTEFNQYFQ